MIQYFRNQGTEDIFNGRITSAAARTCPRTLWKIAARKLDQLDSVTALDELIELDWNGAEQMSGEGRPQPQFPIQERYYVSFTWGVAGPEQVAIVEQK